MSAVPAGSVVSLCVVIPHFSRAALLDRAVASVREWPVVVVDDSLAGAGDPPEGARVIRGGGGSGFARATNQGLALAEAEGFAWVLVLNDDAAPEPGCVAALLAAVSEEVRAAGPLLITDGEVARVESAGIRYSERTGRLTQRTRVPGAVTDVDALSGACLLIPATARFDEGYRHGFEDVALAREIRRDGGRVVVVPEARCAHVGGASLSRRSRAAARAAVAGHLRLVGGSRLKRAAVVGYAVAQVARERGPAERLLGIWEGWRSQGS